MLSWQVPANCSLTPRFASQHFHSLENSARLDHITFVFLGVSLSRALRCWLVGARSAVFACCEELLDLQCRVAELNQRVEILDTDALQAKTELRRAKAQNKDRGCFLHVGSAP